MTIQQIQQANVSQLAETLKPLVELRRLGYQSGFSGLPGRMLYNIVSGPASEKVGSTVTIESMEAKGYKTKVVS